MKQKSLFVIVAAAMLLVSCGGQSQPAAQAAEPVQPEQAPVVAQELPTEGAMEEAAPVEEAPAVEQAPASSNGTMTFTAPQDLFTLEIPDNWTAERDTATIEDTQIDTYTAPDGHAFVQSLVNSTDEGTSAVLKAQYTRDYMKRLYGSDLRFASDVSLADGREKLEWWSDMNKTSGTTYFSTKEGYLYFATTAYEDAYESDYKSVLQDVADSYSE
ncbi:hypothetical protein [Pelolinea submarina]|uniref:PsbP protein n=1 Tax=Pelolinea submarina TaxID=913107 RepID=A0A347ZQ70_9CHLR|nr:hypothetical protein [Pelolinea submarina]REG06221.1 hypothetical protein DFR64_2653 [Pelolinea submarina]BBB47451.1 hypothetical protein Pelsub_P0678 [Pelolinea submarina]